MSTGMCVILVTGGSEPERGRLISSIRRSLKRAYRVADWLGHVAGGEPCPSAGRDGWPLVTREGVGPARDQAAATASPRSDVPGEPHERPGPEALDQFEAGERPELILVHGPGTAESPDQGSGPLLRAALDAPGVAVVAFVEPEALEDVVERFGLQAAQVIELDKQPGRVAQREIRRKLRDLDAERIGAFSGIAGLVEVGLGSALRAFKVPFKGHALAYLQNLLLITFGKSLNGRGLFRITFICSMLKAFSPVGGTFRPMLYIFAQGSMFCLPVAVFGWNLLAVVLGSVLMAWLTLAIKLLVDLLVFGMSFFDAYAGAIARFNEFAQVHGLSLTTFLIGCFAFKGILALVLAVLAWFGHLHPVVRWLQRRPRWAPAPRAMRDPSAAKPSFATSARGALRDLLHWRFVLFFFVSALLMLFFANLSGAGFATVVIRGLCISYVGFLLLRQVDFFSVGLWLDRKAGLGLGQSLSVATHVLGKAARVDQADAAARQETAAPPAHPAAAPGEAPGER